MQTITEKPKCTHETKPDANYYMLSDGNGVGTIWKCKCGKRFCLAYAKGDGTTPPSAFWIEVN